jgi:16S rRNA (cytidine1402-2'-O)-methyltransferase
MAGTIYIVATPIGNLEDITLRAMRILSEVDVILAEDTRVSRKLLDYIDSHNTQFTYHNSPTKPTVLSYHQHSSEEKKLEILKMLMDGRNIALVTDAGTPGISDPGNELISFLTAQIPDLNTVPVPGPSAITALLSVSGFDSSKFMFIGFWPKKKAKKTLDIIKRFRSSEGSDPMPNFCVVFYESPFRILKTLNLLEKEWGSELKIVVGRELTKKYETLYRGTLTEVRTALEKEKRIKGEIVVAISNNQ